MTERKTFAYKRNFGPLPLYPHVMNYKPGKELKKLITVAGPCSVVIDKENQYAEMHDMVYELSRLGVNYLRGGIFRAGTYPSGTPGFIDETKINEWNSIGKSYGMQVIMEVLNYSPEAMQIYDKYSDCYQIGARQMQNYTLLDFLARKKRTIFLKRNMGATVDEWLGAAEWILKHTKSDVVLIERGISTFNNHVRWTPDISSIPGIHSINPEIPVIIDASHSTGRSDLVEPITLAGIAAGANGYLCEVCPKVCLSSDKEQALSFEEYKDINLKVNRIQSVLKIPCKDMVHINERD